MAPRLPLLSRRLFSIYILFGWRPPTGEKFCSHRDRVRDFEVATVQNVGVYLKVGIGWIGRRALSDCLSHFWEGPGSADDGRSTGEPVHYDSSLARRIRQRGEDRLLDLPTKIRDRDPGVDCHGKTIGTCDPQTIRNGGNFGAQPFKIVTL